MVMDGIRQIGKAGLLLLFMLAFLAQSFVQIDSHSHSVSDTFIGFFPAIFTLYRDSYVITYLKGESITWGAKGKDQHEIP